MTSKLRSNMRNEAVTRRVLAWNKADELSAHATTRTGRYAPAGSRGEASMTLAAQSRLSFPGKLGILALMLLVLAISAIGVRDAQAQEPGSSAGVEAVFGTVVEVGENTFTIATDDAINVITVDADTTLRVDESFVELDSIAIGDELAATVSVQTDGSLLARKVLVRPSDAERSFIHVVGVVTDVADGEITLTDGEGGTVTVDLPAGEAAPEIGDAITTVAKRDRVTDRLAAHALEKVEAIVDRLESALARAEELVANAGDENAQAKLEDLKQRIEDNASRHLGLVDQVKTTAVAKVTEALDRKFTEAQRRYEEVSDRTGVATPVVAAKGVVKEITSGEIVVGLPNGGEIRITLATDAVTENIDGDDADVSDFVTGTDVVIEYQPTTGGDRSASSVKERDSELSAQEVARINSESEREFAGTITSVQKVGADELTDAIAIVIIANEDIGRKVVARVTRSTEIKVNEQDATVSDLAPGMLAEVELLTGLVASEIKARIIRPDVDEEHGIRGVVRKIDRAGGVLSIATGQGGHIELHVDDSSVVVRNGEPATFRDILPGDLVLDASRFRTRDRVIVRLVLKSQEDIRISGLVAGIDRESASMTVITDDGGTVRFNINSNTKLTGQHGADLRFADIVPGYRVVDGRITTTTRDGVTRHVATRLVVTAPELNTVRGEVYRVNAADGWLAVQIAGGHNLALSLPETGRFTFPIEDGDSLVLSLPKTGRFTLVKDGQQLDSLRLVEPGDLVHSATFQPLNLTIVKIELVTPGGTAVRGTVAGVDADGNRIKLETPSGEGIELIANADSELHLNGERIRSLGRLSEGDVVVNALYVRRSNGNVIIRLEATSSRPVTTAIDNSGSDERPTVEFRIKGVIVVIEGDTWIVGDTKFLINSRTEIKGDRPAVGAIAAAVLTQTGQQAPFATRIEVEAPETREPTRDVEPQPADELIKLTFTGLIEEIVGDVWMVGGRKFTVNRQTEVIGEPEVGARAGVVAVKISNGELIALQISVEKTTPRFPTTTDVKPTPEPVKTNEAGVIDEAGSEDKVDTTADRDSTDKPTATVVPDEPDSKDDDSDNSGSGNDDNTDSTTSGTGSVSTN